MKDRFGFLSSRIRDLAYKNRVIWIHAVSVGEIKVASILVPLLRERFPLHVLMFSTVTHTGNKVAKTIAASGEGVFYLPFDLSFIADKVVRIIKPELFLCLETELWPNLIDSLYRNNTKIALVNGRISKRSYSGYSKIRFVTSRILSRFSLILVQSEDDRARFLSLGAGDNKVFVTGNLKFDLSFFDSDTERAELRKKFTIDEDGILLVAGSTHRGEEEDIIKVFSRLKKDYNKLRLLIAPRHVERTEELERLLTRYGYKSIRFSGINERQIGDGIFILDTIGSLTTIYSAADIVFMGGSLVKKGGQNPIEPALWARPVIFGSFTFNFQDVVKLFLENKAAVQVASSEELYSAIKSLLDDSGKRKKLGADARDTVVKNAGAAQRTIEFISSIFPK